LKSNLPGIPEPTAGTTGKPSTIDQLKSLAELRERGVLTEVEFEAEKKRVLQSEPESGH
jgi:hypothetical protein